MYLLELAMQSDYKCFDLADSHIQWPDHFGTGVFCIVAGFYLENLFGGGGGGGGEAGTFGGEASPPPLDRTLSGIMKGKNTVGNMHYYKEILHVLGGTETFIIVVLLQCFY